MHSKFRPPRFYPIIDTAVLETAGVSAIELAEEIAAAGCCILQYRHKDNWTQVQFDEAKTIAQICKEAGVLFVVNDRADFAKLLEAGLHIGQEDLPPVASRTLLPNAVIGFSTHNALQLRHAGESPADYLSLGPIFATKSKQRPDPMVGADGLKALRILTTKPLVAIGGIKLENAASVLAAGADSVAVISAIVPPEPSRARIRGRLEEWHKATERHG